jgi:hypothetical protein
MSLGRDDFPGPDDYPSSPKSMSVKAASVKAQSEVDPPGSQKSMSVKAPSVKAPSSANMEDDPKNKPSNKAPSEVTPPSAPGSQTFDPTRYDSLGRALPIPEDGEVVDVTPKPTVINLARPPLRYTPATSTGTTSRQQTFDPTRYDSLGRALPIPEDGEVVDVTPKPTVIDLDSKKRVVRPVRKKARLSPPYVRRDKKAVVKKQEIKIPDLKPVKFEVV